MMNHSVSVFYAACARLASILLLGTVGASASVTTVAWYRLGDDDSGAASGHVVNAGTADLMGVDPLRRYGSPVYTSAVPSRAASVLGSSLSVVFNGVNQFYSNVPVTLARNNFGIEAWVASVSGTAGTHCIAHNGNTFRMDGAWR